jgi:hypothetical protein
VTSSTYSGRRIAISTPGTILKLMRKRATNTIEYFKRRFMMSHLDINQPPKRLWRRITDLGLKKASPIIGDVDVNGLNQFFTSPGPNAAGVFCSISRFYSFFVLQQVCVDVAEAVFSIKSETIGMDNVSLKFVKLLAPSLIPFFSIFALLTTYFRRTGR